MRSELNLSFNKLSVGKKINYRKQDCWGCERMAAIAGEWPQKERQKTPLCLI
jgi:hypothetical protein